jgi:hypothetical protein
LRGRTRQADEFPVEVVDPPAYLFQLGGPGREGWPDGVGSPHPVLLVTAEGLLVAVVEPRGYTCHQMACWTHVGSVIWFSTDVGVERIRFEVLGLHFREAGVGEHRQRELLAPDGAQPVAGRI